MCDSVYLELPIHGFSKGWNNTFLGMLHIGME
jgi:hypothetical protein